MANLWFSENKDLGGRPARRNDNWFNAQGDDPTPCCNNSDNVMGYPLCPAGMPVSGNLTVGDIEYTNAGVDCTGGIPVDPNPGVEPEVEPIEYTCDNVAAMMTDTDVLAASIGCQNGTMPSESQWLCDCGVLAPFMGCTDPLANNYNPNAAGDNIDSCTYTPSCDMMDGATQAQQEMLAFGCYNGSMVGDENEFLCDCDSVTQWFPSTPGCIDPNAFNYNPNATEDDGSCEKVLEGCTDNTAFNYNPNANTDDGSCVPVIMGCMNPEATNYNPDANTDGGMCSVPEIEYCYGCINGQAEVVAETTTGICPGGASLDIDSACIYGCPDPTALNYNPEADIDDGSCEKVLEGCTDPTAFNYNENANTDDGSCVPVILGCMNPEATNYNPDANTDGGMCSMPEATAPCYQCNGGTMVGMGITTEADCSAQGQFWNNYDPSLCVINTPGCTDPLYEEYNPNATTDDGSCLTLSLDGCTDNTAFNYNPNATTDDGSCVPVILGCMNPEATNYNPEANTDTGMCSMPVPYNDLLPGGVMPSTGTGCDCTYNVRCWQNALDSDGNSLPPTWQSGQPTPTTCPAGMVNSDPGMGEMPGFSGFGGKTRVSDRWSKGNHPWY